MKAQLAERLRRTEAEVWGHPRERGTLAHTRAVVVGANQLIRAAVGSYAAPEFVRSRSLRGIVKISNRSEIDIGCSSAILVLAGKGGSVVRSAFVVQRRVRRWLTKDLPRPFCTERRRRHYAGGPMEIIDGISVA